MKVLLTFLLLAVAASSSVAQPPPQITVTPDSFVFTVNERDSASGVMRIWNTGGTPLTFSITHNAVHSMQGSFHTNALAQTVGNQAVRLNNNEDGHSSNLWGNLRLQEPLQTNLAGPNTDMSTNRYASSILPLIVRDSVGDATVVDAKEIRGEAADGALTLQVVLATSFSPTNFAGVLGLDIDQNRLTGIPMPFARTTQDVGCEFYVSFFSMSTLRVLLMDSMGASQGSFPVGVDSFSFTFSIPLSVLRNDDGRMNIASVVGSTAGPTDWVPDDGHGIIGPLWLSESPESGTILPGDTMDILVRVHSENLMAGAYSAIMHIQSNDPVHPVTERNVQLQVIGAPNIVLNRGLLDFGDVLINVPDTLSLQITNNGSQTLHVSGMTSSNPLFLLFPPLTFTVAPRATHAVTVLFVSANTGAFTGTLTIASNDPSDPIINVPLRAVGVHPPNITVSPDSLQFTVNEGDSTTAPLTIGNTGLGPLRWQIHTTSATGPARLFTLPEFEGTMKSSPDRTSANNEQWNSVHVQLNSRDFMLGDLTGKRIGITGSLLYTLFASDLQVRGADVRDIAFPISPGTLDNLDILVVDDLMFNAMPSDLSLIRTWLQSGHSLFIQGDGALTAYNTLLAGSGITSIVSSSSGLFTNIAPHPITAGVDTVSGIGALAGATVVSPAQTLVYNNLSTPFAVASTLDLGRIVFVGDEIAYSSTMAFGDTRLFVNQIVDWLAGAGSFLSVAPDSGVVPAGSSQDVTVKVKAGRLVGGTYRNYVVIANNDPFNNPKNVLVRLRVIGAPNIVLAPDSIQFPLTYLGYPTTDSLLVKNSGSDTLALTSITSSDPLFQPLLTNLIIAPGSQRHVPVRFAPTTTGTFTGILSIRSNDPSDSVVVARLRGSVVHPPRVVVHPDSISFTVLSGDSAAANLTIQNTGLGTLTFSIDHEYSSTPQAASLDRTKSQFSHHTTRYTMTASYPLIGNVGYNLSANGNNNNAAYKVVQNPTNKALTAAGGGKLFGVQPSGLISEIDLVTGLIVRSFPAPVSTTSGAAGLAYSGRYLYFSESISSSLIYVLNPRDGTTVTTFPIPGAIDGLAFLNNKLYAMNYSVDSIYEMTPDSGRVIRRIFPGVPIGGGVDAGNGRFFAADFGTSIYELNINTGTALNSFVPIVQVLGLGVVGNRLFASGSSGGVVEHDPNTGHVLGTLTTGTFYALAGGGDEWLSESPSSGTIVPGGSANVSLNVRSGRLLGGTYRAVVRVRNNDPSRPVADASVQMRVIGAPNIVTSRDTLRYVGTFVGYADTLDLGIGNTGTDTLRVNAMSISSPFFSVIGATTFRVPPSKIGTVRVSFAPTSPGTIVGSLAILSNDPTDSLKTVNLVGSAVHPPAIATSADSLAFTLTPGDSATQPLVLSNTGLGILTWSITHDYSLLVQEELNSFANSAVHATKERDAVAHRDITPFKILASHNRETELQDINTHRRILAWVPYADLFPGGEYQNTIAGIRQFYTDFTVDTTSTLSPSVFASLLTGKDVLLVPKQELTADLTSVGGSFSPAISSFIRSGHVVIVVDYGISGTAGATTFLNGTGLLDIMNVIPFSSTTAVVVDAGNALTRQLPQQFAVLNGVNAHTSILGRAIIRELATGGNMVTLRDIDAGTVIYIGMDFHSYNSYMARLISNAVQYGPLVGWLYENPSSGSVLAGANQTIQVKAVSRELLCGMTYRAIMRLMSNDPARRLKSIPVRLRVSGASHMDLSHDTVSFPESYVGYADTATLIVSNTGCDTLRVTGISSGNAQFSVIGATSFTVARDRSRLVGVRFAPLALGTVASTLTITSNDSVMSTRIVALQGTAYSAPIVNATPDSITCVLNGGDSAAATVKITNIGPGQLRFSIHKAAREGITQEYLGDSTSIILGGSARMIGNIYSIITPTLLRDFKCYLGLSAPTEIKFLVYEGSNSSGPFTRIAETSIVSADTGTRFYSSDNINVAMAVGRYYYIGVAYQASVNAGRRSATLPIPVSFGQMEASGFVSGYPPAVIVSPLRSTTLIWTQILSTGFDFVTSIVPDTAAISTGDSVNVLVRLRAMAPMGTYRSTLEVRSNDPARRVATIYTRLDILTTTLKTDELPQEFALNQNYPNPFNPTTTIRFQIPHSSFVTLKVFDILGREVETLVDWIEEPGYKSVQWDASGVASGVSSKGGYASGVYLYRLQAGSFVNTRKMVVIK